MSPRKSTGGMHAKLPLEPLSIVLERRGLCWSKHIVATAHGARKSVAPITPDQAALSRWLDFRVRLRGSITEDRWPNELAQLCTPQKRGESRSRHQGCDLQGHQK
jgi:hypothetical protein